MKKYFSVLLLLFTFIEINAQYFILNGFVSDSLSGEKLSSVSVWLSNSNKGTSTDKFGFFSLLINDSSQSIIRFSYLGYKKKEVFLSRKANQIHNIFLVPEPIMTEEVVVQTDREKINLKSTDIGLTNFNIQNIKTLPSVGGEIDVMKALQLSSGVMFGQEGSNAIYVRGGGADHNLILLDGVKIYNPNHLFGFFSVFNSDVLKSMDLYKGSIPAKYGGKLSSVLDIAMKEGNTSELKYTGGISLISSRLTIEGPIGDTQKGSFLISGRRTYLDPLIAITSNNPNPEDKTSFYFYDFNTKLNYQITENDRIFLSGYFGKDHIGYSNSQSGSEQSKLSFVWGNSAYNFRWNRIWSDHFFSNSSVIYSDFQSDFNYTIGGNNAIIKNPSIKEISLRSEFSYFLNEDQLIESGFQISNYYFIATSGITSSNIESTSLKAVEFHTFLTHEWEINGKLKISSGLQFAHFSSGNYFNFDPRFSARYLIDNQNSIKLSYTKMHQYIHSLSSSSFSSIGDVFYPSTSFLKPELSQQISLGYHKLFEEMETYSGIEFTSEIYYKKMDYLPLFRQQFSSADPDQIAEDVVLGKGWAYGLELQLTKADGKINGWINYTLNKGWRQYDSKNNGDPFNPKFDRTHQFNLVLNYKWTERTKIGTTFVLASGQPYTVPKQRYYINGYNGENQNNQGVIDYGEIYNVRLPIYNRLDLSSTYTFKGYGIDMELFMNIYNVYGFPNPMFVSYDIKTKQIKTFSLGILPTIGWNFKF